MNDEQLLEAAAKAIGHTFIRMEDGGALLKGVQDVWRPLDDDGDALRLAVKLKMDIEIYELEAETSVVIPWQDPFTEPHGDDPYAATRRAIFRAAASLPPPPNLKD